MITDCTGALEFEWDGRYLSRQGLSRPMEDPAGCTVPPAGRSGLLSGPDAEGDGNVV